MTTRVTEGARRERPLFLASRGSSARALPSLDLLTSRAFERVARSYEREARASERAKVRAGSYHTRPENHANDFEKVYPLSKSEEKERLNKKQNEQMRRSLRARLKGIARLHVMYIPDCKISLASFPGKGGGGTLGIFG